MSVALYESDVQRHHLDSRIAVQVTSRVNESYYLVFCLKWGHKWGQDAPKKPSARVDPEPRLEHTAALLYVRCPQLLPSCQDSSLTTVDLEKQRTCKKNDGFWACSINAFSSACWSSWVKPAAAVLLRNHGKSIHLNCNHHLSMCMHASPCLSIACCAFSVTSCSAGIQDSLWLPRSRLQRRQRPVTQVQGFELARLTGWQSTLYAVRKESRNGLMEGCRDLSRSADPWIQAIMTSCKWMPIMSITLRSLESRRPYSRQESRCCILVRRVNTTSQLEMSDSKHAN